MPDGERPMEARIEELVQLEEELREPGAGGGADGVYEEGFIAGAERVPSGAVPEDYPVPIDSERALRIDVETTGGVVETYVEWAPDEPGAGHVERLLDVLDREPGEFADVFGDRVALDYRNGYHGIDPEGTERLQRSGTENGGALDFGPDDVGLDYDFRYSGTVVAALVVLAAVTDQLFVLGYGSGAFSLSSLLAVALPLAVAYDCRRMAEESNWDPLTLAWAAGAFVPFFNVPITTVYLLRRRTKRLARPGRAPAEWLYAVLVGGVASAVALPLVFRSVEPVVPLLISVVVLLPLAVYFDFEAVPIESGRRIRQLAWTGVTAALALFLFGFVAAGAYLYYRTRVLDG